MRSIALQISTAQRSTRRRRGARGTTLQRRQAQGRHAQGSHVQGINAFDYPSVLREVYPDYYIPLLHGAEDWARAYLLQNNLIG